MALPKTTPLQFEAIGTSWIIDIYDGVSSSKYDHVQASLRQVIERFDRLYSRFRADSLVSTIAHEGGEYELAEDGVMMLTLYKKLYDISDGLFTPFIGSLLASAGYDQHYSFQKGTLTKPVSWEKALTFSPPILSVHTPALLDFGALGKGKLIDIIGNLLETNGIASYCVDGSGDLLYKNALSSSLKVGLEHPENPQEVIGVTSLQSGSLCASSGNRRKWGKYHHIMDPHILTSPKSVLSTWVIAETAMLADALATCLFLVDPKVLFPHFAFKYLLLKPDYTVEKSPDFPCELYYNKEKHA